MNTGAEAVETALKAARRWAYDVKGIEPNQAEIIAFNRTSMVVQWPLCLYHLKLNINVDMVLY